MKFAILATFLVFALVELSRPLSAQEAPITPPSNRTTSASTISWEKIPVKPKLKVGFSSVWDPRTSSTYFADHFKSRVYRYSWNDKRVYIARLDTKLKVAFVFPSREFSDQFFVGAGNKIYLVKWNGVSSTANVVKVICEAKAGKHMNHAVAGPHGEFIFGTLSKKLCRSKGTEELYQYSKDSGVKTLITDLKICSGVAITETTMFSLDACQKELVAYDRDYITGELSNRRVLLKFDFPETHLMTGLVIDTDGNLYTGLYGGSAIIKINPNKKTFEKIKVPAAFVADPGFSGPNNDVLMVPTGSLIPHFYKAEYTGEETVDEFHTVIDTSIAGSVLAIHGLGARSNGTLLPAL